MEILSIQAKGIFFYARACARVYSEACLILLALLLVPMLVTAVPLSFNQASNDIHSSDLKHKYAAIHALKDFAPQGAAALLAADLAVETDVHVRRAILESLTLLKDPSTIPAIAPLLSDSNALIRQRAAYAIGLIGGSSAEGFLAKALPTEKDRYVRETEIQGLGLCGSGQSLPLLLQQLKDKDPEIRSHVIHTLGRIPGKASHTALISARGDSNPQIRKQVDMEINSVAQGAQ